METRNSQPFRLQLSVETTAVVLYWAAWIYVASAVFRVLAVLRGGAYRRPGVMVMTFLMSGGAVALVLLGLSAVIRAIGSLKPKAE
jgi:hypothetical protein